ncbi:sensor histidine kinase [Streptomyces coeruleoprunus]|uniref:Sensor histidine kinase n=1 Tax=Streptomyces coeruleoprunus TaxID=285563 RepID=A0ABV9XKG5_9ACTN
MSGHGRDHTADVVAPTGVPAVRRRGTGRRCVLVAGLQTLIGLAQTAAVPLLAAGPAGLCTVGFLFAYALVVAPPVVRCLAPGRRPGRAVWAGCTLLSLAAASAVTALVGLPVPVHGQLVLDCLLAWLLCWALRDRGPDAAERAWEQRALVRAARAAERRRFGRDLHDLLGFRLSALALKVEVASRLLGRDDERVRRELREVLGMSRQALAEARSLAERYRELSLPEEIASVREVLTSSGMRVTVVGDFGPLDPRTGTVMATVLREGVTNLLRHSSASVCRIRLVERQGRIRLVLSNDGVRGVRAAVPRPGPTLASAVATAVPTVPSAVPSVAARGRGSGLDSLTQRLAEVGGTLTCSTDGAGWFHLVAECPARPVVSAATPSPGRSGSRPVDCAR